MKSILVILFLSTAAWGVEAPPPADADLLRLQEAFRLAQTIAPRVWNGFAADDAPIVLIRGEFEYVLNDDVAPDGFEKMTQSFRAHPIYARPRTFPPGLEASFPAIGRDAVVIGVPEVSGRTAAGWSIIVCHELFHVYQRRHGMAEKIASLNIGPRNDANWQLNYPFPYKTERVVRALNLLGHTIDAGDALVAGEALENLTDIVAATPKDLAYMKFVITNEGVARYFEYRVAQLAATDYRPSDAFGTAFGADSFARVWRDDYVPMTKLVKHLGRVSQSRNEFYNFGLGLGLLLDRVKPDWQSSYFDAGLWLDDIYRASAESRPAN